MKLENLKSEMELLLATGFEFGFFNKNSPVIIKLVEMLKKDWINFNDDKHNRWIGFCQALMWISKIVDIKSLKEMTRNAIKKYNPSGM